MWSEGSVRDSALLPCGCHPSIYMGYIGNIGYIRYINDIGYIGYIGLISHIRYIGLIG